MIYLVLAILSSAAVSILMRTSEKHIHNNVTMLAGNYVVCSVLAAFLTGSSGLLPQADGRGMMLMLGAISGVLYLAGFLLLQWNVRINGVTLSATFMKLGVLVPTLMAILCFGETLRAWQLAGLVLAVIAILLIQLEKGAGKAVSSLGLVVVLLAGGLCDSMSKIYEVYGNPALNSQYLFFTFLTAFILCAAVCLWKRQGVTTADVLFGLLIGIPNYGSARFLLLSLGSVPAVVAFPTFSVATIILVTLCGVAFFRERLSRRQLVAMAIILVSLILLNL